MLCSSPMSARTSSKTGRRLPASGGDRQAGLRHQAEQADRLERDGLAAGVRAGDQQHAVGRRRCAARSAPAALSSGWRASSQARGWRARGSARLRGRRLASRLAGRARRRSTAPRRGAPPPAARSSSASTPTLAASRPAPSPTMRAEAAAGCARPRAAPRSAARASWFARSTTASGSMKSGGAAGRDVVDDAAHLAAEVGLDRHDVAAVAQGDDRLLGGEPCRTLRRGTPAGATAGGRGRS